MVNQVDRLARRVGLPVWRLQRLLDRYGSMTDELMALAADDHTSARAARRCGGVPPGRDRVRRQPRGALHLDDILARRTRISIETPDRGTTAASAVADLVAPILGWDEERIKNEVESYAARVEAERRSQQQDDDLAADAARIAAPDTRAVAVGRALD